MSAPLRHSRSLLFLPASNPRAIVKARSLAADMIILDCEDAVKPEDKDLARDAAAAAAREGYGDRLVAIRVNPVGTMWHGPDLAAVAASSADFVILPKTEAISQAEEAASAAGKPVLAMIETAAGILAAADIARGSAGLIIGTNDLCADLGIQVEGTRAGLVHALQATIIAARAAAIAVFDGVYNQLDDEQGLAAQCQQARAFGFDGKSLIHPGQIDTANRIFSPSEEDLSAAARLLAAARGGAERFEGRMIETMHVDQARAMLARAGK